MNYDSPAAGRVYINGALLTFPFWSMDHLSIGEKKIIFTLFFEICNVHNLYDLHMK